MCIEISDINEDVAYKAVDEVFGNYDNVKNELASGCARLKEKARRNGEIAIELYEKGSVKLEQ